MYLVVVPGGDFCLLGTLLQYYVFIEASKKRVKFILHHICFHWLWSYIFQFLYIYLTILTLCTLLNEVAYVETINVNLL